jgi:hypothetical protein
MLILAYPPSASKDSAEAAAGGGGALGSPRLRDFKLSKGKNALFRNMNPNVSKGLSHEDFKNVDKNLQNLAYLRDAAGF